MMESAARIGLLAFVEYTDSGGLRESAQIDCITSSTGMDISENDSKAVNSEVRGLLYKANGLRIHKHVMVTGRCGRGDY
jgi:hypothetical protein